MCTFYRKLISNFHLCLYVAMFVFENKILVTRLCLFAHFALHVIRLQWFCSLRIEMKFCLQISLVCLARFKAILRVSVKYTTCIF